MSRIPWIMAFFGIVLGAILPIETVQALISAGLCTLAVLTVVLIALVAVRRGRWAFAWRGQRCFVAMGVAL